MVDFSLIGSKLNHNNLPNKQNSTKMSMTLVKSALDRSNMEALSSIKKALKNATGLGGALMINGSCDVINDLQKNKSDSLFPSIERKVIDLTYSPETGDNNKNCKSSIVLSHKIKIEEVVTASLAKAGTPDGMARLPSATNVSPMSSALSKVDGLTALKMMNTNGGRHNSRGLCNKSPVTDIGSDDGSETIKVATEPNAIGAVVYKVKAKPYRAAVKPIDNCNDKPWDDLRVFSVPGILKLYCHKDSVMILA
jgi:hypothetical protein